MTYISDATISATQLLLSVGLERISTYSVSVEFTAFIMDLRQSAMASDFRHDIAFVAWRSMAASLARMDAAVWSWNNTLSTTFSAAGILLLDLY